MDALPLALLRLRESEIVRLCGLARAARGQELARQGKLSQAARVAGTLRATMLEGETVREVAAQFSDAGLDSWECSCPLFAEARAAKRAAESAPPQEPLHSLACEHVAALLAAWLREPRQFQVEDGTPRPAPPRLEADGTGAPAPEPPAPALPVALEELGPLARRLVGLLALAGGSASDEQARRLFARMGLGPIEAAPQTLSHLRDAGWLVHTQPPAGPARWHPLASAGPPGWAIPAAQLAQVPREVALEGVTVAADAAESGATLTARLAEGQHLPEQLVLALGLALAPLAPNGLPVQLQEQLGVSGEQARFWLALLYHAGLLSGEQANLKAPAAGPTRQEQAGISSGAAGDVLLRGARWLLWRASSEVARDLLLLWLHARPARELDDLRDAGLRVARLHQRNRWVESEIAAENQAAKAFVLDLLGAVPAGRWWSFGAWVEFVWRFRPDFLRARVQGRLRPEWWLERLEDGAELSPDVRAEWRQGEGRYLALLFRRACYFLGLLDLAFDARGRLQAFRITAPGAEMLKRISAATPPSAGVPAAPQQAQARPLEVQSAGPPGDERLLVPLAALCAADAGALEALLYWCEPDGATASGLLLRPSARRVAAALDAKRDLEGWLAVLEASAVGRPAAPALGAVVGRARGWAAAYGRVRLSPDVALLEVSDAGLMRELERVVHLDERRDHALSPEMAVFRPAEVEPLLEELRRRGYSPWIIHDEATH